MLAVEAGAPGDRVGGMLSFPEDQCALLLARATDSVDDVDLFAFGEDGSLLGSDEAPDQKATVLVCPPHPPRAYVVARIVSGYGLVAVGSQLVAPTHAKQVGEAVGARGTPGEPEAHLAAWPGLEASVAEHRRRIGSTWQDVRRVAVPVDPRAPTRISASVEAGKCLDVLALPSAEVSQLDVNIVDTHGRIVGRAAARGRERAVVVCSPTAVAITVELRPHSGRGLVALVLSRSPEGAARDIDARILRFDVAALGDLDRARADLGGRLERAGYDPPQPVVVGALHTGRRTSVPLALGAGCSRVEVIVEHPVSGVDAWIWTEEGELLARGTGGSHATLFACGGARKVRADVEPKHGNGRFAIEVRTERDTPAVLSAHALAGGRLVARMVERGVIRRAAQVGAAETVDLAPTRLARADAMIPVGRCMDFTLALGEAATGAEMRIVERDTGAELALARGTTSTSARVCTSNRLETSNARVEMRTSVGDTVGLFATRMLSPKE